MRILASDYCLPVFQPNRGPRLNESRPHSPASGQDDPRLELLRQWLERDLGMRQYGIAPASADASFRRYFRLTWPDGQTRILMDAPPELRAAGFGDVIGKTTALADWRLGYLLWGEPHDPAIDRRVRGAMASCCEAVDDIASGSEAGIRYLFDALIETVARLKEYGIEPSTEGTFTA